jgi:glycosyltransferase involved in cell wall biosynthesis
MEAITRYEKGISICIPIYNCDVSLLVQELHKQVELTGYPYEIILIDDGSTAYKESNRGLQNLPNTSYTELEENMGRAKIRNLLARKARYSHLLFLDCDTQIDNPFFIRNYIENGHKQNVIIGGYRYSDTKPEHVYVLRWLYGKKREEKKSSERNKNPNKSFSTFNFFIAKEIFDKVQFDESISGYGHEDTLFGWDLKKNNIAVYHIDNPILHKVLDKNDIFIQKNKNSVRNLWKISQRIPEKDNFYKDIKLLKIYSSLQKYHLTGFITVYSKLFHSWLYKNLLSKHPSIFLLDLYKLAELHKIAEKE